MFSLVIDGLFSCVIDGLFSCVIVELFSRVIIGNFIIKPLIIFFYLSFILRSFSVGGSSILVLFPPEFTEGSSILNYFIGKFLVLVSIKQ